MSDQTLRTTFIIIVGMTAILLLIFLTGDFFAEPPDGLISEPVRQADRPPF